MKTVHFIPGWGCDERIWQAVSQYLDDEPLFLPWDQPPQLINGPLVGYSLGGVLALQAAASSGVGKLVLVSATARMPEAQLYEGINPATIKAMRFRLKVDREGLLEDFARLCTVDRDRYFTDLLIEQSRSFDNQTLSEGLRKLEALDLRQILKNIKTKTLIIHGTEDRVIPFSQAQFLQKHLPNTELIPLSGGHDIIISQARVIAERIEAFLTHG